MSGAGQYSSFGDVAIFEALRTPWVDLGGALAQVSPIDLGIKVGREVLARAAIDPSLVDSVLAGSMAQASFDAYSRRPALAHLLASAVVGVVPEFMGIGPAPAIQLLLQRSGLALGEIGLLEINEAQAAQVLAVAQALELDGDRLNRRGGSIALGHPLAATGLRLVLTLARQLREGNLRYGIAAACVGGGQGMALLIENPAYQG
ncbi:thiolase family protein [Pseudomonas farris]